MDREPIEKALTARGYEDFRWIGGGDIEVAQWVRMKCAFGCNSYGAVATCPPATPPVAECRKFFSDYGHIAIIHLAVRFADPEERKAWSRKQNLDLLKLERDAFLLGHHKAFLLFMDECRICAECPGTRAECVNLDKARPSPESLAVDVFATVRKAGYPIVHSCNLKYWCRYQFLARAPNFK